MALKDAVATILNRNAFYRDGYRLLLRISLIQTMVIVLLVASFVGLIMNMKTQPVYFATTTDGRIIPIVPLSEPYRSQADVVTWAARTAQDTMRFDYDDYRTRLQNMQNNFTMKGWESFNKALKDSSIIEAMSARKLVVMLVINAAPEITNASVHDGVYTWDMRFPVTIKYDGTEIPTPTQATLFLRVVRVSTLQNSDGIGIEQWIMTAGNGSPR